jgi:hypothetical protein
MNTKINFLFGHEAVVARLKMNGGFRLAAVHFANRNFSFRLRIQSVDATPNL